MTSVDQSEHFLIQIWLVRFAYFHLGIPYNWSRTELEMVQPFDCIFISEENSSVTIVMISKIFFSIHQWLRHEHSPGDTDNQFSGKTGIIWNYLMFLIIAYKASRYIMTVKNHKFPG